MALGCGLFEELHGARGIALHAGLAIHEGERQPVLAFGRSRIGGALDEVQPFGLGPAIDQDRTQPGRGIGIRRPERAERPLRGCRIALPIRRDGGTQRRGHIRGIGGLLGLRGSTGGNECRDERQPRRDHFVLNW